MIGVWVSSSEAIEGGGSGWVGENAVGRRWALREDVRERLERESVLEGSLGSITWMVDDFASSRVRMEASRVVARGREKEKMKKLDSRRVGRKRHKSTAPWCCTRCAVRRADGGRGEEVGWAGREGVDRRERRKFEIKVMSGVAGCRKSTTPWCCGR